MPVGRALRPCWCSQRLLGGYVWRAARVEALDVEFGCWPSRGAVNDEDAAAPQGVEASVEGRSSDAVVDNPDSAGAEPTDPWCEVVVGQDVIGAESCRHAGLHRRGCCADHPCASDLGDLSEEAADAGICVHENLIAGVDRDGVGRQVVGRDALHEDCCCHVVDVLGDGYEFVDENGDQVRERAFASGEPPRPCPRP